MAPPTHERTGHKHPAAPHPAAPAAPPPHPPRPGRSSSLSSLNQRPGAILPPHHGHDQNGVIKDSECTEIDESFAGALSDLCKNAVPLTVGFCLEAMFPLVSTLIAGRLGPNELAVVGGGIQLVGVTTSVLILSSTAAQTTLSAPLFTLKSANPTHRQNARLEIGILAQRGFILAHLSVLPMIVLWLFIEPIMIALGQPENLAAGLETFLRWMILSVPGYALMETAKAFLQAQSIFHPATYIVAIVLPIHTALTYYLVFHTPLRENGASLSVCISYTFIGLGLVLWISKSDARQCWGGWSRKALQHWGPYLRILIPSSVMFGAEWWNFEIVTLLAGRLGENSVAAEGAISSMDTFLAMIPYAIGLASTIRLGQLLGHNTSSAARAATTTVRAGYVLAIAVTAVIATCILAGRWALASWYVRGDGPQETRVKQIIANVLIPIAMYQVSDAVAAIGTSILRCIALQNLQAVIITGSYYILGLPLGIYLAYRHSWGLVGLWTGTSVGLFWVGLFGVIFYCLRVDWKIEMRRAEYRSRGEDARNMVLDEDDDEEEDEDDETEDDDDDDEEDDDDDEATTPPKPFDTPTAVAVSNSAGKRPSETQPLLNKSGSSRNTHADNTYVVVKPSTSAPPTSGMPVSLDRHPSIRNFNSTRPPVVEGPKSSSKTIPKSGYGTIPR